MDRTYTAEDFTGYLSSIICNGVFDTYGDYFSVTAGSGTSVVIGTGKAWIDGHYFINDTAYTLDLTKYVDESLSRYVIIGIKEHCINYCGSLKEITYEGTLADLKNITGYKFLMSAVYCPVERISCVDGAFVLNGETWEEVIA